MFEFLSLNANIENPSEVSILFTVAAAFFLSSVIAITYEFTTKDIQKPTHFIQSMALISIVSATVMLAIGDSLARGLGMLGALAIIRFRTKLDDPRNITFMFAAIAAGIACGVLGFATAFIGTIGFCLAAILLRFSPLSEKTILVGTVSARIPTHGTHQADIQALLRSTCKSYRLSSIRYATRRVDDRSPASDQGAAKAQQKTREPVKELVYQVRLTHHDKVDQLMTAISSIDRLTALKVQFDQQKLAL